MKLKKKTKHVETPPRFGSHLGKQIPLSKKTTTLKMKKKILEFKENAC